MARTVRQTRIPILISTLLLLMLGPVGQQGSLRAVANVATPQATVGEGVAQLASTYMAASGEPTAAPITHYPLNTEVVYFHYTVVTPAPAGTGQVTVRSGGPDGPVVSDVSLALAGRTSISAALGGNFPAGGYCTSWSLGSTAIGAAGFTIGQSSAIPDCGPLAGGATPTPGATAVPTPGIPAPAGARLRAQDRRARTTVRAPHVHQGHAVTKRHSTSRATRRGRSLIVPLPRMRFTRTGVRTPEHRLIGAARSLGSRGRHGKQKAHLRPLSVVSCAPGFNCGEVGHFTGSTGGAFSYDTSSGVWNVTPAVGSYNEGDCVHSDADRGAFAYKVVNGDTSVQEEVASYTAGTDPNTYDQIGVMMRTSLSNTFPNLVYSVLYQPNWGTAGEVVVHVRGKDGPQCKDDTDTPYGIPQASASPLPVSVKIVRAGNTFTAYYQVGSSGWTVVPGSALTFSTSTTNQQWASSAYAGYFWSSSSTTSSHPWSTSVDQASVVPFTPPVQSLGNGSPDVLSHPCQTGSCPINDATGNFWHTFDDLAVPGRGLSLDLTRTYNSLDAGSDGPFGFGWTSSYGMQLLANTDGSMTVREENGSQISFLPNGSGGFVAPSYVLASLVKNGDNTYTLTRRDQSTYVFLAFIGSASSTQLMSESDRDGNTTALHYTGTRLTDITDPASRTLTYTYVTGTNHVASITDGLGRTVQYQYNDAYGNLTDVIKPNGGQWHFSYDTTSHHLLTMKDPVQFVGGGAVVTNTYVTGTGQIQQQSDQLGRVRQFAYAANSDGTETTTITAPPANNASSGNQVISETYQGNDLLSRTVGVGTALAATTQVTYDPITLGVIGTTRASYGPVVFNDRPLAYYRLNESSGTVLKDLSGNSHDGSYTATFPSADRNAPTTMADGDTGIVLNAGAVNGGTWNSTDYAQSPTLTLTSTYSFEAWVKPSANTASGELMETILASSGSTTPELAYWPGSTYAQEFTIKQGTTYYHTTHTYAPNAWYHLVYTWDGTNQKLYVNGTLDLTQATSPTWGSTFYVGVSHANTTHPAPISGSINEVAIYGSALSASQVTAHDGQASTSQTVSYTYDSYGNVLTAIDPLGHEATYTYYTPANDGGNAKLDNLVHTATDACGNLPSPLPTSDSAYCNGETAPDASGHTVTLGYNSAGDLTSASAPRITAGTSSGTVQTTFTYGGTCITGDTDQLSAWGNVCSVTDPNSHTGTFTYDSAGDTLTSTDANNRTTDFTYDTVGDLLSVVSPRGICSGCTPASFTTWYVYTSLGEVCEVADAMAGILTQPTTCATASASHLTLSAYDPNGRLSTVTDGVGNVTSYTYDAAGEQTAVAQPDGAGHTQTLSTSYDAAGNVASQVDGLGKTTWYVYDALDRPCEVADPLAGITSEPTTCATTAAAHTTLSTYAPSGTVQTSTDGLGTVTTGSYDAANRLTQLVYSDGTSSVTSSYDAVGRQTGMVDGTGTSSFTYNSLGQLLSNTNGASKTMAYAYDAGGNLTSTTYPDGLIVARAYGPSDLPTSLTVTPSGLTGVQTTFSVDRDGNRTAVVYPNGVTESAGWANNGLQAWTKDRDPSANVLIDNQSISLDGANRIYNWNDLISGKNHVLAYDGLTRLTQDTPGSNPATTYGYDTGDNPTQTGDTGSHVTNVSCFDVGHELTSVVSATGSVPTCTATPILNLTYNATGARTSQTPSSGGSVSCHGSTVGVCYDYNGAQELTGYTSSSTTATYTYDGTGLRSSKTVGGSTTSQVWDLSGSLPTIAVDGTTDYVTDESGTVLESVDSAGNTTYYGHDWLGSTRELFSSSSTTPIGSYVFDAYGKTVTHTGTATTPFQYAGQYTDSESGLQYLRARYYDPSTQQFLTMDPIVAATGQPYSYAGDNPVSFSDPSGLCQMGPVSIPMGGSGNCSDAAGTTVYNTVSAGLNSAAQPAYAPSSGANADALAAQAQACGTGSALPYLGSAADVGQAMLIIVPGIGEVDAGILAADESYVGIEDLIAEVENGGGKVIIRPEKLTSGGRLADTYGGNPENWAKITSRGEAGPPGNRFQLHWYRDLETGKWAEVKIKPSGKQPPGQ